MKFKVLSYNILFGMKGNNIFSNFISHMCIYGVRVLLPNIIGNRTSVYFSKKRSKYLKEVISIIKTENPDIICLNEVLMGFHKEELERKLKRKGYKSFIWSSSTHYESPINLSTVLISKFEAEELLNKIYFKPAIGSGSGCAIMKIKELDLIVLGVHASPISKESRTKQIKDIYTFIKNKKNNSKILLLGDYNQDLEGLKMEFPKLFEEFNFNLKQKDNTFPYYYVPKIRPKRLDHIFFLNEEINFLSEKLIKSISDHKAVINELELK